MQSAWFRQADPKPDPDSVGSALGSLGADVSVIEANSFRLEATIETGEGVVTLR